ncbi:MAG: ATP-binding protein [Gemmatimonadaceae bacterium]
MLLTSVAFAVAATILMGMFARFASETRGSQTESVAMLREEQRIAEEIVSGAHEQQLDAFQYLQRPAAATLDAFRTHGARVYEGVNRYLFRDMPLESRLRVETIKEAHQDFEVAAQRAFDLSATGASAEAHARADVLSTHISVVESAVRSFVSTRQNQRDAQRALMESRLHRVQMATAATALLIVALAIAMAEILRRRMMRPLTDLSGAVRQLGDGVGSVRVARQHYPEFQLLADSFEGMAQRIRSSRCELEERNGELTQTLEELRRAQQELVQHEKLSAVGEMLAGLAHELNNPLAGVLGLGEVLQTELALSSDVETRALVPTVVTPLVAEAVRARQLVRNLLHFSRQSEPQLESVRLADAVEVGIGLRRHMFAQEQKIITVDVPSDLTVVAQEQKLQHIVINVVNNALDALIEGNGSRLRVAARRLGDDVVLQFDDDGPGFREPARAFDAFYTTKVVGRGTGLGLTLVHRFAQEFGGSVTAENSGARGARVTLHLRSAARTSGADCPALAPSQPKEPSSRNGDVEETQLRQRVLVVDDEPALRQVQRRYLSAMNLVVVEAANGVDACVAIAAAPVDLVITDLRMPGTMSGQDLLEWLAREHPLLAERALVVTGDISGAALAAIPSLTPDRVLTKPFDRAEYEHRVRQALDVPVGAGA